MAKAGASLAEQLLELHIQHELNALTCDQFFADTRGEVDRMFELLGRIPLRDLVSPEQIHGVIHRNVVQFEIHGGIPELAGEMAAKVRAAPVQETTRLKDLLSREQVAELIDEILTLRHQRERLVEHVMEHALYRELVAELVYHGLVNYIYEENLFSRSVPGIAATMKLGKRMFSKAIPGLDESLEKNLKAYIAKSLPFLIRQSQAFINGALSDEELKESANELWALVENKTLAELQSGIGELELSEFVVLGYEFWQGFRKTDYYRGCYEAVVEHLFDKYGDQPLDVLIGDMGVTPQIVKTELEAFGPGLFNALKKEGYLEELLRRRLGAFYHSEAATKLLVKQERQAGSEKLEARSKKAKPKT